MLKIFIKRIVTNKYIEFILLVVMILCSYCVPVYFVNFSNRKLWAPFSLLFLLLPSIIICLNIYFNTNSDQNKKTSGLLYRYVLLAVFLDIALIVFGASYGPSSEIGVGKIQLFAKIISSPELLAGIGVAIPTIYIWIREGEEKEKEKLLSDYQSWVKDFLLIKDFPKITDKLAIELLLKQDSFNLIERIEIFTIFQRKFSDFERENVLTLKEAVKWQEFFTSLKINKDDFWEIINSSDFPNIYFIDFSYLNSSEDMQIDPSPVGVKKIKRFAYSKFPDTEFDCSEGNADLYFYYCLFDKEPDEKIKNLHLQPKLYYLKDGISYNFVDLRSAGDKKNACLKMLDIIIRRRDNV